ncbi:unnamed protein product, partial [Iphiclides podalirius]
MPPHPSCSTRRRGPQSARIPPRHGDSHTFFSSVKGNTVRSAAQLQRSVAAPSRREAVRLVRRMARR